MNLKRKDAWTLFLICGTCVCSVALLQMAFAYDPKIESDLKYSRDALLKQRTELRAAMDRKATLITELQRDNDRLNAYLQDTDKALQNIELALKGD